MGFFDCVRSGGATKCPVDEGFVETATFLMLVEAHRPRRLAWGGAVKEKIGFIL